MSTPNQTFRTINIEPQKFVAVINPDTILPGVENVLTWNTGIYGGGRFDNAMPNFLIDIFENGSSAHQSLVRMKGTLILGNNLQAEDSTKDSILNPFLKKRNKAGHNPKSVYSMCSKDYGLFNSCVVQAVFNRNGEVSEIYHINPSEFRLGIPNKYGNIDFGYISKGWPFISNSIEQRKKESVKIKMWDPSQYKKYPVQLVYMRDYSFAQYATPAYMAGINWILLDRDISNFHRNNTKANFWLSGILSQIKGGMDETQIAENAETISNYFAGVTGRKVLLAYPETIADKPVFDAINGTDQDKLFDILAQQCFQQIVTAHGAYPVLAGMDKSNNLGGDADRLLTSLSAFDQIICEPMKQVILDGFNMIFETAGLPAATVYTEMPKLTKPIQLETDTTEAERRNILFSLPPKDDSTNSSNNPNTIGV